MQSGDRVEAGHPLVEGALIPQDILRINGEDALQYYLLREVQGVYRSQNVSIDEKHIEVIVSQMLRRVQVVDPGDTDFLPVMETLSSVAASVTDFLPVTSMLSVVAPSAILPAVAMAL